MKNEYRSLIFGEISSETSSKIIDSLQGMKEYAASKIIMYYISKKDEVSTSSLLDEAFMSKITLAPFVRGKDLFAARISGTDDLEKGGFGIPEPKEKTAWEQDIDLVIVPAKCFDILGTRIGSGKGYYDRFLARTQALKIGLIPEERLYFWLPREDHDIAVDIIVTEKKILYCR